MPRNKGFNNRNLLINNCNSFSNQNLILVTILAAIIGQEIENDEELALLGTFFIVLGEQLSLLSESRIICKETNKEFENLNDKVEGYEINEIFLRSTPRKRVKKIKKKYIKKYNNKK